MGVILVIAQLDFIVSYKCQQCTFVFIVFLFIHSPYSICLKLL